MASAPAGMGGRDGRPCLPLPAIGTSFFQPAVRRMQAASGMGRKCSGHTGLLSESQKARQGWPAGLHVRPFPVLTVMRKHAVEI